MMADSDYSGSGKPLDRAPCSRFMNTLADDYFQPEQPSFEGSYAWCVKLAKLNGFEIPSKSKAARYLLKMADERNSVRVQPVIKASQGESEFFALLTADYLRLPAPSFAESYRRIAKIAHVRGWSILSKSAVRRKIDKQISRMTQDFLRGSGLAMRVSKPEGRK